MLLFTTLHACERWGKVSLVDRITSARYVCLISGACMTSLDIAIVLDGSASMGIDGFHSIKQFVIDMISRLDVGPEKVRVCVVRVALDPIMEIELTKFSTALDLENAVSQVIYYQGATGKHRPSFI